MDKVLKSIKVTSRITLGLIIVSFVCFIFNLIFFINLHLRIYSLQDIGMFLDKFGDLAAYLMMVVLFSHLSAIITIILELRFFNRGSFLRSLIFFVLIFSFIMIFGDFALSSDIIKEYKAGLTLEQGILAEFIILYLSQLLHLAFFILIIILLVIIKKRDTSIQLPETENTSLQLVKDEAIFINAQYVGILTAIAGIIILSAMALISPLWTIKKGIVMVCAILVFPYVAIVAYWFFLKLRERITEWYDEKQFQDLTKAGLITFLSSMLILVALFLFQNLYDKTDLVLGFVNTVWFPFYFFIVLLIFSSIILYLNKRAED